MRRHQVERLLLPQSAASRAAQPLVRLARVSRRSAFAAEKPPLAPDTVAPFTTDSRISATIEFGLPALASEIERDMPRRLATIDERVSCVHRRVLFWRSTRTATSMVMSSARAVLHDAANAKLNRPLKDGYRMEGDLSSANSRNCICRPTAW